jgi:glycerophosphoryl diester phosphodiesterase
MASLKLPRISRELVDRLHAAGVRVIAWTVNTPGDLALARALGLDGAVTDTPEIKRAVAAGR